MTSPSYTYLPETPINTGISEDSVTYRPIYEKLINSHHSANFRVRPSIVKTYTCPCGNKIKGQTFRPPLYSLLSILYYYASRVHSLFRCAYTLLS